MSGHQNRERLYMVGQEHEHAHPEVRELPANDGPVRNDPPADGSPPPADPDLHGNDAVQESIPESESESALEECETLDEALLQNVRGNLETGWLDWAVTDGEATAAVDLIQNASPEQQALLVEELRASGELHTLLDNLPEEARAGMAESLTELTAEDQVHTLLETGLTDWMVTQEEQGAVAGLFAGFDPQHQATLIAGLSADERASTQQILQDALATETDPQRRLSLWSAAHQLRITEAALEVETVPDGATEEERALIEHRNAQRAATADSSRTEVNEEFAHYEELIASGTATMADIEALMERKDKEFQLEQDYGLNLTNDAGSDGSDPNVAPTDRRVWGMGELGQLEGAFSRMPVEHLRDNTALTEIRRVDVRRDQQDDGTWTSNANVGADAGSGRIRFFDTGTGYDAATGTESVLQPWRLTDTTSELAGHDEGHDTSLVEEVLSHEAGHTVHQGDDQLFDDFKDIAGWETLSEDELRARLAAEGWSEEGVEHHMTELEATRGDHYGSRNAVRSDKYYQVNPYNNDNYLGVNDDAVPMSDPNWGYALSNPSDHFAEIYTKAIHAPEELHADMISGPAAAFDAANAEVEARNNALQEARAAGVTGEELTWLEEDLQFAMDDLNRARESQDMREQQWTFFRERVFGTDDSDIQALEAPPGKEEIYAEYQEQAAMCQTPQQLAAVRERYADQL